MGIAADLPPAVCPACEATVGFRRFAAREMLYGWREPFTYCECGHCGTLHLATVPADLGRFYPPDYYSLAPPAARRRSVPSWRRWFSHWVLAPGNPLGGLCARGLPRKQPFFHWARLGGAEPDSAILDVGCGSGGLLRRMQRYGFTRLTGVDPYAAVEIAEPGLRVLRAELATVEGKFDLIMMNHVLEHVADPARTLTMAGERLNDRGRVLVRIPVAGSRACRDYGADWFNLDAPRHLVIPSVAGLGHLARRAGLRVVHTSFDGNELAFSMSESYRRDVPARAAPLPDRASLRRYRRRAKNLNRIGEGDLGIFVLSRR